MNNAFMPLESCIRLRKTRESIPVLEATRHKTSNAEFAIKSLRLPFDIFVMTKIIHPIVAERVKDSPRIRLEKYMLRLFCMSRNMKSGGTTVKNILSITTKTGTADSGNKSRGSENNKSSAHRKIITALIFTFADRTL